MYNNNNMHNNNNNNKCMIDNNMCNTIYMK